VDFIAKPTPRPTPELVMIEQELLRKVHAIRDLRIEKVRDRLSAMPSVVHTDARPTVSAPKIVAIGSSTGGPAALMQVFGAFSEAPPCFFLVARHMPRGFTGGFAERLDRLTPLSAREATGGETPEPGSILVAPGGSHLELENVGARVVTRVVPGTPGDKYTPSVDRLFASAAKHFGSGLLAVVLTGMGDDGREGVTSVKECGGSVIAESESTAVIFGMPQQAIRTGAVDQVLPLVDVANVIQRGVSRAKSWGVSRKGQV
jgi:two-component system chemotaxis response regulator CheB